MTERESVQFPGARRPDRRRTVDAYGLRLAVYEWGDENARPILFAHGGFDFAGTFDVFAPLIADAGYRVVCWDQRGHGDSDHAPLYAWAADTRDALAVLDSVTSKPIPMLGHSKGAAVLMQLCEARPHRVERFVNLDGLPSRSRHPDVADHERTRMLAGDIAGWLDRRRNATELIRKPGTIDELARRRGRMNPRLPLDWLRYLVPIGARRDADGWRWKIDAIMRFGGFGPWRPDWYLERLPGFPVPMLALVALVSEPLGWETKAEQLQKYLAPTTRIEGLADTGHFVHIERPREVADLVLEFLS